MAPQRTLRYYYLRVIRLRGEPSELARGVGIGMFIGITPTIPLHTVLILLFTIISRGSKIAGLLASVVVSNPLTIPPTYYLSWRVGEGLTGTAISWANVKSVMELVLSDAGFMERLAAVMHLGREALVTLLLGGFVLALPFGVAGYFLSYRFFANLESKRRLKHILR
ncbi:MAG: DUF2062 domain-containing protein [Desulfobulbaceae bacterium]|nr:DUF2062 domain-containing protein [Desulfobulbaceae bacterium]